jgi:DNA repair exonuclease SbcCD nuclease subunit
MTTALIIGDIHLNVKNLQRSKDLLNHLLTIIRVKKPDIVIQFGDVFHNHNILHLESLQIYTNFLSSVDTHFFQLVGNHDMINSVTLFPENHAHVAFNFDNVTVVDKPQVFNNILFLPYIPTGQFEAVCKNYPWPYEMIICHQEFKGAEFFKGVISENGDAIPNVPTISGHIHTEAHLGNVWYPGTPIQHDHGDCIDKAVWLVDLKPNYEILERIEIPLPKYRTIKIELGKDSVKAIDSPDFIRYEIVGDKADMFAFKQSQEYKKLEKAGKVKISLTANTASVKFDYKTFNQLLKEYSDNEKLEHIYGEIIPN